MTFEEFKATARIDRHNIKVYWQANGYEDSCIWWRMPKQTDEQVLRGVWWAYYGKNPAKKAEVKAEAKPAEPVRPKGVWYQPTITNEDSSACDLMREKVECEWFCGV